MSSRRSGQSWLPKRSISSYQAYALMIGTVLGVGTLIFPRPMAKEVGTDGILVIPLVAIIAGFMIFVISKLGARFPGMSLVGITREVLGAKRNPWPGRILSIPFFAFFVGYWVMAMATVTRNFGQVLATAVYKRTPVVVLMLLLVVAAAFVSHSRADVLARFNEFLLPLVYAPGILLLAALFQVGEVQHLLPLFQADWKQVLKGVATALYAYSGFEVALIFMAAYQEPKKALRPHLTALFVITTFGYGMTYVASMAVFGREELIRLTWPVLELVKVVEVPGGILERLESAVLAIWVIAVFTTLANMIFAIVHTLHVALGLADRHRKWVTLTVVSVIYGLALKPENLYEVSKWTEWISYLWFFSTLFVPLVLYVIARIRRKRGESEDGSPAA